MRSVKSVLRVGVELALLGVLVLGLAAVIGGFLRSRSGPMPGGQAYPPPGGTAPVPEATTDGMAYPPPGGTLQPPEIPLQTPAITMPIVEWKAWETPTPWLTFTPPPQPTRRPGPTETPRPLLQPALDAAGSIIYVVSTSGNLAGEGKTLAVSSISVDKAGLPEKTPIRLTGETELIVQWGWIYPSPDGSRLAIQDNWGIVTILNLETGRLEPIALAEGGGGAGGFLGWYPDSRRILYRQDAGWDAGLVLVDTQSFTGLVRENASLIRDAAVSPDGQKVVYSFWRGFGGYAELRMINLDGSNPHVLYTSESDGADIYFISWSPDGSKITFMGDKGYMVMDADGANVRALPIQGPFGNYPFEPVWSPDSHWIAYVTCPQPEKSASPKSNPMPVKDAAIRLIDVVSGEDRPLLTDGSTGSIDPAWSPDGKQIAIVSIRSGSSEIWVVNVDGSNLRQLTNAGQFVRYPYWRRP